MISVALPAGFTPGFIDELFGGIFEMAAASGVAIIGGDTSASRDSLFIDTIAIGECPRGQAITRGGAEAGNRIYVTGALGASALGLALLEKGFRLEATAQDDVMEPERMRGRAVLKHLAPEPRLKPGEAIGRRRLATAMIDVSDGLSTDLSHILDESRCGAVIRADSIPTDESLRALAPGLGLDPMRLALHGGEEYELLFTARPEDHDRIIELSEELGIAITHIGEITAAGELELEYDGAVEPVKPSGYEHKI
jgi:thiamine-monophosphate kinase